MEKKRNKELISAARYLRKNMTKEERHLWYDFLRDYPVQFKRQEVIIKFVVDYFCPSAKLAIELDGSQHYEPDSMAYDEERTKFLEGLGIRVIRIPNNEVNHNFRGVCEYIDGIVKRKTLN